MVVASHYSLGDDKGNGVQEVITLIWLCPFFDNNITPKQY